MTDKAIELFYSYAHEDEALRNQLDKHLKLLQRQGYITQWYDRDIGAGSVRSQEIEAHLGVARILLLLVSPDFMASDYCYGVEMQQAMKRHRAGEATVIPVILRSTYLKNAPFADLEMLPKDARPVTLWPDLDAAFHSIVEGISGVVDKLNGKLPDVPSLTTSQKKKRIVKEGTSIMDMPTVPATPIVPPSSDLNQQTTKKAVTRYYKELKLHQWTHFSAFLITYIQRMVITYIQRMVPTAAKTSPIDPLLNSSQNMALTLPNGTSSTLGNGVLVGTFC